MALYRRTRSTRVLVVSLVMLSLLTITIDFRGGDSGPFAAAGRATLSVVGPLQAAVSRLIRPVGDFLSGLANIGTLQAENEALRAQLQRLRQDNSNVAAIKRERDELLELFRLRQRLRLGTLAASVIAESVSNLEWSITIDRGSTDGVRVDMPVVSGDGLVGHVVQVASRWSSVQLVVDPDSAVAGRLVGSGETGLVTGQRADRDLRMELVDPDAKVLANEQVVTSGYQGGLYPPGLLIGVVSHVYRQPGSLSKLVAVRPAVDLSALESVLVVMGPKPRRSR